MSDRRPHWDAELLDAVGRSMHAFYDRPDAMHVYAVIARRGQRPLHCQTSGAALRRTAGTGIEMEECDGDMTLLARWRRCRNGSGTC